MMAGFFFWSLWQCALAHKNIWARHPHAKFSGRAVRPRLGQQLPHDIAERGRLVLMIGNHSLQTTRRAAPQSQIPSAASYSWMGWWVGGGWLAACLPVWLRICLRMLQLHILIQAMSACQHT